MERFMKKWGLALKVLVISSAIVAVKVALHFLGFEPISTNSLYSTIIGGATFLIGFILAGTLADYKEAEKIPSEVVSSMENIYEEGIYLRELNAKFDFSRLNESLRKIASSFRNDVSSEKGKAIRHVSELSQSILEAEKLGIPPIWIARLKSDQATLKKTILRMYHIQKTQFIPAAYALVDIIILIITTLLMLMKIEPLFEAAMIIGVLSYIYIYMTLLIKDMDNPFNMATTTYAEIDMFLLNSFEKKIS